MRKIREGRRCNELRLKLERDFERQERITFWKAFALGFGSAGIFGFIAQKIGEWLW